MRTKFVLLIACVAAVLMIGLAAQQTDAVIKIDSGQRAALAVADFRGSGQTQSLMDTFNATLWSDLQGSGIFRMVPKSLYPLQTPQTPNDFKPPVMPTTRPRKGQTAQPVSQGPWLTDWSGPPVNANYLAFGYAAVQGSQLVAFGYLYNVTQNDTTNAQVLGKLYFGSLDEAGARKVAHEFATDILGQFGQKSLIGSKIYFVSDRSGPRKVKEVWSMDYDGSNQQQLTRFNSTSTFPTISGDNSKLAFTSFYKGVPQIVVFSLDPFRQLRFYNQTASLNAYLDFFPDGQKVIFCSTLHGGLAQIYTSNPDGTGLQRLSPSRSIEVEPKVNPKTGTDIVFISGRSGHPQLYKMNRDGADVVRLTTGEGEVANPSWHPDGQHVVFSWTRGYEPGNYNIFVMDVATRRFEQLTHGAGRNENPSWAPDGRHIVFSSTRSGSPQIFTMLADGAQLKQLTTAGRNEKPVWSK